MARTLNINEFSNQVHQLQVGLPAVMLDINRKMALDAIELITDRLVEKGITGEGKSLGQYSDKPISPGYFIGAGLGSGADTKVQQYLKSQKKAGGVPGISYKKFRELNNLPTAHVTLSFTGETLGDLGVLEQNISGSIVSAGIGSKNSKTKVVHNKKGKETGTVGTDDVLDQLEKRYGDILSLNPTEELLMAQIFDRELQQFLDRTFE